MSDANTSTAAPAAEGSTALPTNGEAIQEITTPATEPSKANIPEELWEEFELKVNGKQVKEKVNLKDKEGLKKHLQMSKAAHEAMQSKAEAEKHKTDLESEIQEFFKLLKSDPKAILRDPNIGIDLKKFAEEIMNEELEKASKDPKELELETAKKQLESIQKEREEEKKRLEADRFEALVKQHETKLESDIMSALQSQSLPNNPLIIHRIGHYMETALQQNIDLSVADVLPIVMNEIQNDVKEMVKVMKPEQVKALFGDVVDGLRKEDIKKIKEITNLNSVKDTGKAPPEANPNANKMSIKQWMKGASLSSNK